MKIANATRSNVTICVDLLKDFKIEMESASPIYDQLEKNFEKKLHSFVEDIIDSDESEIFISFVNNFPNGICVVQNKPYYAWYEIQSMAYVSDLFVLKKFRNSGFGSALLKRAEEWAERRGLKHIWLETILVKKENLEFYQQRGFSPFLLDLRKSF